MPEVPQLSFRGCAIPERPAVIERPSPEGIRDRLLLPFGFRKRAAGKGRESAESIRAPTLAAAAAEASASSAARLGSVSSATAAPARSANARGQADSEAAAASRASRAERSASSTRPSASQQRVSSSSQLALQPRGINGSSSPPLGPTRTSTARRGSPVSTSTAASAIPTEADTRLRSSRLVRAAPSSAVLSANSTSPAASATSERLTSFRRGFACSRKPVRFRSPCRGAPPPRPVGRRVAWPIRGNRRAWGRIRFVQSPVQ